MSWNFSYRMNQQQSYFNVQYDENGNIENRALRENALRENALRENALRENALRENTNGQSPSLLGRLMLEAVSGIMNRVVRNLSTEIETNLMRSDVFSQQQANNRPQFIVIRHKNMPNKKEHTSCPICFDDYTDNCFVLETECKHHFHEECLEKWTERNNTCPICRTNVI